MLNPITNRTQVIAAVAQTSWLPVCRIELKQRQDPMPEQISESLHPQRAFRFISLIKNY